MNESDKEQFAQTMVGIGELYAKSISPQLISLYWEALKRYELDEVVRGLNQHVVDPDSGQFMPKPADVVRQVDGDTNSQALTAWSKVEGAISRVGHWRSVVFDDAIIHAVIEDMGGWTNLCMVTNEEIPYRRNEFEKRYRGYANRGVVDYPKKLMGRADAHNEQQGFPVNQPVMIGDVNHAKLILEGGSDKSVLKITHLDDEPRSDSVLIEASE